MKPSLRRIIPVVLSLMSFLVFAGALRNGFTNWDDDMYVTQSTIIESLAPGNVAAMFSRSSLFGGNWAPLTTLSYAFDHAMWQRRPFGYHLTNLLLHVLCTLLLYEVIRRILGREDAEAGTVPAALAAALFTIHPVQVESVAWIAERKNLLGMAFLLGAFLAWLRATEGRFRTAAWVAFLALFCGALLSKAQAVILVPLLALHEWILRPDRDRVGLTLGKRCWLLVPALALAMADGWITIVAQKVQEVNRLTGDLQGAVATAPTLILGYVRDLLFPMNRAAILTPPVHVSPWLPIPLIAWAIVLAWTGWALMRRRAHPRGAFFSLWFLGALAPVLNLIPITVLAADRYQYWAAPGLFVLAGLGLVDAWSRLAPDRRSAAVGLGASVAGMLAALTLARVPVWLDSLTLWQDGARKAPRSAIACNNLGDAYNSLDRLDEAESWLRAAMKINPVWTKPQANLGLVLVKKGFVADGTRLLERSLAEQPDQLGMLATAYAEQGRWKAAYPLLQRAIAARPRDAALQVSLGNYYFAQGDEAAATATYRKAMEVAPGDARVWNRLGAERFQRGETAQALEAFRKALALDPRNAKARANLGAVFLATGRFGEAEVEIQASLRIDPRNAQGRSNLGAAMLAQGRPEEAEREIREALRIDPHHLNATYNLACAAARRGDRDRALESLGRLMDLGYHDVAKLRADPDLDSLHGDPRFNAVLARRGGTQR